MLLNCLQHVSPKLLKNIYFTGKDLTNKMLLPKIKKILPSGKTLHHLARHLLPENKINILDNTGLLGETNRSRHM